MKEKFKKVKRKTSFQSGFLSFFFSGLLLIIIGFLVSSNLKIYQKRKELKSQLDSLKKELQVFQEKNQSLKAKIAEIQKEDYLEKEAREKLGLKKPGEEVVVVIGPKREEEEKKEKKNFWQKLLSPAKNFFESF